MIYAISAVGTDYVKFGVARDIRERLSMMQTGCPFELEVLAVCEGGVAEERDIHSKLALVRLRGEWFTMSPAVEAVIQEMKAKNQEMPRLPDSRHVKSRRAKLEQRTSRGWIQSRQPAPSFPRVRARPTLDLEAWRRFRELNGVDSSAAQRNEQSMTCDVVQRVKRSII